MKENGVDWKKEIVQYIELLILPISIAVLWQISTTHGWIRTSILPSPEDVWDSAKMLIQKGYFWEDLSASLGRIIKGFLLGGVLGIGAGIIIGIFPLADRLTKVCVAIFRPIPIISLIPLFILWMGIGEASKIAVITIGTFWALVVNTMDGIKGTDKKLIELANVLGKSRWETIRYIIFPYAFPAIFTGIRVGISASIGYVITAEMIAASAGIGYRIMYARNMALPGIMFVGVIEIGILGLVVDLSMLKLQQHLFRYR